MRAEAYQRETRDPRVRYENLFDPLGQFPEASYDRIQIAPDSATARGLELFVRGPSRKKWNWWASYVYSETFDEIDGREQMRSIDQPHAVNLNVNYKPSSRWNFNALWTFHSGPADNESHRRTRRRPGHSDRRRLSTMSVFRPTTGWTCAPPTSANCASTAGWCSSWTCKTSTAAGTSAATSSTRVPSMSSPTVR